MIVRRRAVSARRPRGLTLIELVVAIAVVAAAVSAVLGTFAAVSTHSADALARQQAVAIAEAYLEEIVLKPVADPDGTDAGEAPRAGWDDVDDYDGLADLGARDQLGNAPAALADYRVAVRVTPTTALTGVPAASARRVDVTVERSPGLELRLTGYRTDY